MATAALAPAGRWRSGRHLAGALTLRGRCLVAAGASAAACGLALGQRDLLRIAVLLLALPLGTLVLAARGGQRLSVARTTQPERVPAGGSCRVRLDLSNDSRLPTGVLLAQDVLHRPVGPAPRFVLDRLSPGQAVAVAYTAALPVRGRHVLGPLRVRIADPFGLCELPAELPGHDTVLVLPVVEPLDAVTVVLGLSGAGDAGERAAVAAGERGMGTREYRAGDDLRRVHWRSTARRGELMVRQDEQPRQQQATVLLDRRPQAHRGSGPSSTFERAVSAAASLSSSLLTSGCTVRIAQGGAPGPWQAGGRGAAALLDHLAAVELGSDSDLTTAARAAATGSSDEVLVAVLGRVAPEDARPLAALGRRGRPGLAVLVESPVRGADAVLRGAGWTVLELRRGETLAPAWARLKGQAA